MVITELRVSSGTHCLLNGTSVDIKCVNYGFPRPEIIFFRGAEQITPGQGSFSNFERMPNKFDTIRLTEAQRTDGGQYVCEARDGSRQLSRSQPVDLVFCSKCQVDYPAPSLVFLHQTSAGRRMEVCFFLETAGESSTVLGGQHWRSTAYWSVIQECTTVRCLMLVGWPQGVCN